jgi:hypothetical protein
MYFECVAASLAECCAKCCRPELHRHYFGLENYAFQSVVQESMQASAQAVELEAKPA